MAIFWNNCDTIKIWQRKIENSRKSAFFLWRSILKILITKLVTITNFSTSIRCIDFDDKMMEKLGLKVISLFIELFWGIRMQYMQMQIERPLNSYKNQTLLYYSSSSSIATYM
ncbi:hypothetical protein DERF_003935 [Dermatophagoides farinae]|uniref:Uncharacterized protein n=1 Tax=Dermatophagoides farinae TaxID=6954 RepID=A0A922IEL9_DERFA|nr:hypothetical protein DERF_003935 [Dermatophagoides farinae]